MKETLEAAPANTLATPITPPTPRILVPADWKLWADYGLTEGGFVNATRLVICEVCCQHLAGMVFWGLP